MSRSRNIKPGFFKNEELADCQPLARILFAGLWTIADREGRLEDRPRRIKAEVLPYDSIDADILLNELASHGFIVRYTCDAQAYIAIPTFAKNQQCHVNEAASVIPPPEQADADTVSNKEEYRTSTVQVPYKSDANSPLTLTLTESYNSNLDAPAIAAPGEKAKRKHRIPDSFCLTEEMIAFAKRKGFDKVLDLEKETDEFHDYWRGRGEPMLDWVATWQSRIRSRAEIVSNQRSVRNGQTKRAGLSNSNGRQGQDEPGYYDLGPGFEVVGTGTNRSA